MECTECEIHFQVEVVQLTMCTGLGRITKQDQTLLWTGVAGAHLQCVNNHYAKFQYICMKSVLLQITHKEQCKHSKGGVDVIMSKFNSQKYYQMCTKYRVHTCSMCEQS